MLFTSKENCLPVIHFDNPFCCFLITINFIKLLIIIVFFYNYTEINIILRRHESF